MIHSSPVVTYLRVSTDRQGQSGLGLEAQRAAVTPYVEAGRLLGEFVEVRAAGGTTGPSSPLRLPYAASIRPAW